MDGQLFAEISPTDRSKCKICKGKIEKGTIRITVSDYWKGHNTHFSFHPNCVHILKEKCEKGRKD